MNKFQLIKTNNSLILVSGVKQEELKDKDFLLWKDEIHQFHSDIGYGWKTYTNMQEDGSSLCLNYSNVFGKVISQSPKLSKEVQDEIGWIDVEELADKLVDRKTSADIDSPRRKTYEKYVKIGFRKAEELNQKKYTEEDFFNFCQVICEKLPALKKLQTSQADDYGNNLDIVLKIKDEYIQPLSQPQQWACEAEEIDGIWNVTKILNK